MSKIYTKTGDDGTTGLIAGTRVGKDSLRITAYGTVDELNAVVGLVRSHPLPERTEGILQRIQNDLFTVGAHLALPPGKDRERWGIPAMSADDVLVLEKEIDECEALLEPLREFILPGGVPAGALLHLARTVCRRAERYCVALSHKEEIDALILTYLNRLSDLCFVLARYVNHLSHKPESHPTFGKR